MHPTFKKLNYTAQPEIFVLNAPQSFTPVLAEMRPLAAVQSELSPADQPTFMLSFCTKQAELDTLAAQVAAQTVGDVVVWVAYPKGTSRRYRCEFNRDSGWQAFGAAGFEPVRQVAIDEDWSALRLRRAEFIKTMKRSRAMSEAGKKRISRND